jgi:CspA family cold shock protein
MTNGTVKLWNEERGFGFVTPDDGQPDVFVHVSCLPFGVMRLESGQKITFDREASERKPGSWQARSVQVL